MLERARQSGTNKRIYSFRWHEEFRPRDRNASEIQLVYLHGKASFLRDIDDEVIFSLKEYLAVSELSYGWHSEFKSDWVKKPFIVCGARLQDEFDLELVLDFGNKSRERGGCPSLVVLRSFKPGQADRFRRRGLIPVQSEGEQFFKALNSDLIKWRGGEKSSEIPHISIEEVMAKFKKLKLESNPPRRPLDFYSYSEARWEHVIQDLDAPFIEIKTSIDWLKVERPPRMRVILISGGYISGKTTAALRIGADLARQGYEAWLFRAEESVNKDRVIEFAKKRKSVFIFDDCADFSSALYEISVAAEREGVEVIVIATTDKQRLRAVKADLISSDLLECQIDPLTRANFINIFEKRNAKGRLGQWSSFSGNPQKAWKEFAKNYSGKLLEWLESLENSQSYRDAISNLILQGKNSSGEALSLLVATAAVHRFGYSLPFHVAEEFLSKNELEAVFDDDGELNDVGYLDDKGARLRSKALSKFAWEKISTDLRFQFILSIAKKLSPLVTPKTISMRTQAYLIIKNIMDHESICRDVGGIGEAEKWYSELESSFGWNARFWEQRALLWSDSGQHDKAYSYAKKAVSILERDSFPHTTLGKICVKIGVTRKDDVGVMRFWEGVNELRESRRLALEHGLEWEHPYITFFTYSLKAVKEPHFRGELERLNISWDEWMSAAKRTNKFLDDHKKDGGWSLNDFQRDWMRAVISRRI